MSIDIVGSANAYQPLIVASQAAPQSSGGFPLRAKQAGNAALDHSAKAVHDAVDNANQHMEAQSALVRFNITQEAGRAVVSMVDTQTNQVLLRIPNLQMVRIAQNLDKTQGLAVQRQA
jgi:uncharacterized FlaG/YvyC family protein